MIVFLSLRTYTIHARALAFKENTVPIGSAGANPVVRYFTTLGINVLWHVEVYDERRCVLSLGDAVVVRRPRAWQQRLGRFVVFDRFDPGSFPGIFRRR